MWQLKYVNKVIDHLIVSLYTNLDERRSYIKFGSWDPTGIAKYEPLTMLRTVSKHTWGLEVEKMAVLGTDYTDTENPIISDLE